MEKKKSPVLMEIQDWRIIPEEKNYRICIVFPENMITITTYVLKGTFLKEDKYCLLKPETEELMNILSPEKMKAFLALDEDELKKKIKGCRDSWYLNSRITYSDGEVFETTEHIVYKDSPVEEAMEWILKYDQRRMKELSCFKW